MAQFALRERCLEPSAFALVWHRALLLNYFSLVPPRSTLSDMDQLDSCFERTQKTTPIIHASIKLTVVYDPQTDHVRAPQILLKESRMPELDDDGRLSRWSQRATGMYHLYATRRNEIYKVPISNSVCSQFGVGGKSEE
jgi:hypothetical protein